MRRIVLSTVLLGLIASQAEAASLSISGYAGSGPADNLGGQLPSPDSQYINQTATTGTISDTITVPFLGCCGNTYATAKAEAGYGVLRAGSESFVTGLNGPPYVGGFISQSQASAKFADTLTFLGGAGNGTATVQVTLSGILTSTGDTGTVFVPATASASYDLRITSNCYPAIECLHKEGHTANNQIDAPGTYTFTLSFLFGQPIDLATELWTQAYADGGLGPPGLDSYGTADFGSTFTWDGIVEVRDYQGVVSNFSVTSASGANYAVSAVPLPPTLALVLPGVLAALGFARRRGTAATAR
jgi:hypothetical protein